MKNKNSNKLENKNKAKKIAIYGTAGLVVATIIVVPTVVVLSSKNNNAQPTNAVNYSFNGQKFNTLASAREAVDKAVKPANVFTFGNNEYKDEAQAWTEALKTATIDNKSFNDATLPIDSDISLKDFTGKIEFSTKGVYTTSVNGKTQTYQSQSSAQAAWLLANPNKVDPVGDGSGETWTQADIDASKATPAPAGATVGLNTAHVAEVVAVGDGSGKSYSQAQIDARDKAGNLPGTGAIPGVNTAAVANNASDNPNKIQGPSAPDYSHIESSTNIGDIVTFDTNAQISSIGIDADSGNTYDISLLSNVIAPGTTYFIIITENNKTSSGGAIKGAVYSTFQLAHDHWLSFFPNKVSPTGDGSGKTWTQADIDASKATPAPAGATVGLNTAHVAEVVAVGDGSGKSYSQAQIDARDKAGNLPGTGAIAGVNTAAVANKTSDAVVGTATINGSQVFTDGDEYDSSWEPKGTTTVYFLKDSNGNIDLTNGSSDRSLLVDKFKKDNADLVKIITSTTKVSYNGVIYDDIDAAYSALIVSNKANAQAEIVQNTNDIYLLESN